MNQAREQIIQEWEKFYKDIFYSDVDLSSVYIPEPFPSGFHRVLIITEWLTTDLVMKKITNKILPVDFKDLRILKNPYPFNNRTPERGTYAIRIRDQETTDEKLRGLKPLELKAKNIKGMTLLEYLIFFFKYHLETGRCIDDDYRGSITVCSGTWKDSPGGVVLCPGVCVWEKEDARGEYLLIGGAYSDLLGCNIGAREVIA